METAVVVVVFAGLVVLAILIGTMGSSSSKVEEAKSEWQKMTPVEFPVEDRPSRRDTT